MDLFSHFRWQYALFFAVWLILSIAWHRRALMLLSLLMLGQQAWLIADLELDALHIRRTTLEADFSLHAVCLNVLFSNLEFDAVLHELQQRDADVVFLLEMDATWAKAIQPLFARYPYRVEWHSKLDGDTTILSKIPLQQGRHHKSVHNIQPWVEAVIEHQGKRLRLIGTHPKPPYSAYCAQLRDDQMNALAAYVKQCREPVLLMGDFNATPYSHGLRLLRAGNQLDFRSDSAPWWPTWQVGTPLAIPIDHSLCTPPLVITQRNIGPDVGSDHRAQDIVLRWQKGVF